MRRSTGSAHRRAVVALATAALVALAGCSTTISGTATAATSLASVEQSAQGGENSSAPAETTDSGTVETSTTDPIRPMPPMPSISGGSGNSGSGATGGAQTLDGASINWLTEFCTGFSDVASYAGPDTTGLSDDEIVREVATVYQTMSTAASHAEAGLKALPQPTFPGQQRIVPAALDWFHAVTAVYGQGAKSIAGTTFHSLDELSAAIDKVEGGMDGANERFGEAIGEVDPSVTDAMRGLPECSVLVDSAG